MHTMRPTPASAASRIASGRKTSRYVDDAGVGARLLNSLGHRVKDRHVVNRLSPLARSDSSHDMGAIFDHFLGVKCAFAAGDALHQKFGVFVNQDTHFVTP